MDTPPYETVLSYERRLAEALDNLGRWSEGADTIITRQNVRFLIDAYYRKERALKAALGLTIGQPSE